MVLHRQHRHLHRPFYGVLFALGEPANHLAVLVSGPDAGVDLVAVLRPARDGLCHLHTCRIGRQGGGH